MAFLEKLANSFQNEQDWYWPLQLWFTHRAAASDTARSNHRNV